MKKLLSFGVLCIALLGGRTTAQITVEDFKNTSTGFDLVWGGAINTVGSGPTTFTSNNEIGRLSNGGPEAVVVGLVQMNGTFPWNPAVQRYAQIMVPNLTFGNRLLVWVFSDANGFAGALLHDQFLAVPGQGPRPQTFDINAGLPNGSPQNILIRLQIINDGYAAPGNVHANIDWLKLGMPTGIAPGIPGFVGPVDGAETVTQPTMSWTTPAGFTNDTYTVTYSQDPLFSDATTVTVLDSVTGTSYTPAAPLAAGTWYWTVSATNSDRTSGEFLEKALAGDSRDPAAHRFYSFIVPVPVELSTFDAE